MSITTHTVRRAAIALLCISFGLATTACGHGGDRAGGAPAPGSTPASTPVSPPSMTPGGSGGVAAPEADGTGAPRSTGPGKHSDAEKGSGSGATVSARSATTYAELVDVWRATPSGYGLSYDKLTRLTGRAALEAWKKNMPYEEPQSDWFDNVSPKLRDVVLSPDANIHGNVELGGTGSQAVRLTPEQLVDRFPQGRRVLVTLVTAVVDGRTQVVRLDEIYVP